MIIMNDEYQLPADVIKFVLRVTQGDLGVGQLLVQVVDRLLVGGHLEDGKHNDDDVDGFDNNVDDDWR